ncbi:MAG: hypothetical protein IPG87_20670 [Saprospiraceae bacterium]|nr:hypothetical protein [Candidatus Vicinibacter affinis]
MKKWIFVGLFSWGLVLQAQTFDDLLQNYIGANKEAYLQPVVDLMTGSFNSGWNASGAFGFIFLFEVWSRWDGRLCHRQFKNI